MPDLTPEDLTLLEVHTQVRQAAGKLTDLAHNGTLGPGARSYVRSTVSLLDLASEFLTRAAQRKDR